LHSLIHQCSSWYYIALEHLECLVFLHFISTSILIVCSQLLAAPPNAPHPNNAGSHGHQTDPRLLQRPVPTAYGPHYSYPPRTRSDQLYHRPPINTTPGSLAQPGVGGFVQPRHLNGPDGRVVFQTPPMVGHHGGVSQPTGPVHQQHKLHHMHSMSPLPPSASSAVSPVPIPRHRSLTSPPLPPKPHPGSPFPGWEPPSSPPTLPPKIPLYPQSIPGGFVPSPHTDPIQRTSRNADNSSRSEDDELAMALALSASESGKREKLSGQEEEELARAMEESMITQQSLYYSPTTVAVALDDNAVSQARSTNEPSSHASNSATSLEVRGSPAHGEDTPIWSSVTHPSSQISGDEAYARWLAAEEELAKANEPARNTSANKELPLPPPLYGDVVPPSISTNTTMASNSFPLPSRTHSPSQQSLPSLSSESSVSLHSSHPQLSPTLTDTSSSSSISNNIICTPIGAESYPDISPNLGHPSQLLNADASYLSVPSRSSSVSSRLTSAQTSLDVSAAPARTPSPRLPSAAPSIPSQPGEPTENAEPKSLPETHSVPGVPANQFIDSDLLYGVCKFTPAPFLEFSLITVIALGFVSPMISTSLVPMPTPMPNVISLPFGKCPALHIMAPTWRHLLKLLARLSGTRVEPTVQAMAVAKVDMKLRVVVQFTKVGSSLLYTPV
jgi:hypothetical protein